MREKRISPDDLHGKTIDIHSHTGLSLKAFASGEYPYCQSVESLRYRQRLAGVDYTVTFPFSPELFFDVRTLVETGRAAPADLRVHRRFRSTEKPVQLPG